MIGRVGEWRKVRELGERERGRREGKKIEGNGEAEGEIVYEGRARGKEERTLERKKGKRTEREGKKDREKGQRRGEGELKKLN